MRHKFFERLISCFPQLYWRFKVNSFLNDPWQKRLFPQHEWFLRLIKKISPESILEVGCGFGRNLKFLIDNHIPASKLTGADISAVLLARARLPKSVRLIQGNVLRLPFAPNQFELVFTHGLLMHLSPRQFSQALTELVRVSQKYLILIEEIRSRPRQLNYFTWAHDYDKMITALPLKAVIKKLKPHSLVCYLLKK